MLNIRRISIKEKLHKIQQNSIVMIIEFIVVNICFIAILSIGLCADYDPKRWYCCGIDWTDTHVLCPTYCEITYPKPIIFIEVFIAILITYIIIILIILFFMFLYAHLKNKRIDKI